MLFPILKKNVDLLKQGYTIEQIKDKYGLLNHDLAKLFKLTEKSYNNSTAKKRYEDALCKFYDIVKNK